MPDNQLLCFAWCQFYIMILLTIGWSANEIANFMLKFEECLRGLYPGCIELWSGFRLFPHPIPLPAPELGRFDSYWRGSWSCKLTKARLFGIPCKLFYNYYVLQLVTFVFYSLTLASFPLNRLVLSLVGFYLYGASKLLLNHLKVPYKLLLDCPPSFAPKCLLSSSSRLAFQALLKLLPDTI